MWSQQTVPQVSEAIDAPQLTSLTIGTILGPHKGLLIIPRKLQSLHLRLSGIDTCPHIHHLGLLSATLTRLRLDSIVDLEELQCFQSLSALRHLWVEYSLNDETALTVEKDLAYLAAFTR